MRSSEERSWLLRQNGLSAWPLQCSAAFHPVHPEESDAFRHFFLQRRMDLLLSTWSSRRKSCLHPFCQRLRWPRITMETDNPAADTGWYRSCHKEYLQILCAAVSQRPRCHRPLRNWVPAVLFLSGRRACPAFRFCRFSHSKFPYRTSACLLPLSW